MGRTFECDFLGAAPSLIFLKVRFLLVGKGEVWLKSDNPPPLKNGTDGAQFKVIRFMFEDSAAQSDGRK
jgi:hypothetical protein